MIKISKNIASYLMGLAFTLLFSCSTSVKKAEIPNTANPQDEIAKLDADLTRAVSKNIDILDASDFKDSLKWLNEAKSDQEKKKNQDEILEDLRRGRGYLEMAYQASENRAEKVPGLFEARQYALRSGVANYSDLKSDLQSLDGDVSSSASEFAKVSTEKISAWHDRYLKLEQQSIILNNLGSLQAMLNGAKKNGAIKKAPLTYKKADLSIKNAESFIAANLRNPQGYHASVVTAQADTTLLNEVLATIQQNGSNLPESTALKMVSKNSQIKALTTDLSLSAEKNAATKAAMTEKNQELTEKLKDKDHDLNIAQDNVETQKAMESARLQFSPEEAEAYQQGGNLLIRLKQMNFASGRSELPGTSLALLAKVSLVAKSIHASEIRIEGHTDSIGGIEQNNVISEKRAAAVASYFKTNGFTEVKSEGYGFQKPIATNKSKEGRAQNRRVDIIMTPDRSPEHSAVTQ